MLLYARKMQLLKACHELLLGILEVITVTDWEVRGVSSQAMGLEWQV